MTRRAWSVNRSNMLTTVTHLDRDPKTDSSPAEEPTPCVVLLPPSMPARYGSRSSTHSPTAAAPPSRRSDDACDPALTRKTCAPGAIAERRPDRRPGDSPGRNVRFCRWLCVRRGVRRSREGGGAARSALMLSSSWPGRPAQNGGSGSRWSRPLPTSTRTAVHRGPAAASASRTPGPPSSPSSAGL